MVPGTIPSVELCRNFLLSRTILFPIVSIVGTGSMGRSAVGTCFLALILVGCSNGRGSVGEPPPAEGAAPTLYSVSGTVTGLAGSGLVLRNNGSDDVAV